ncbi:hypothetical protein [Haloferula sp. BvORR071]|uniref:hypothetical protein n=1 Tax=Haloferula sp. BvORR071 TaxID=1396141 RepID=UPI00054D0C67|nr:hypothetical protein [Haloferula sp. BvORR071]
MLRSIAHILQKSGWVAIFVALAYVYTRSLDTISDKPDPNGPLYLLVPFVVFVLVLGYGAFLRGKNSRRRNLCLWLLGAAFLLTMPRLLHFQDIYWKSIEASFVPKLDWGELLPTIGSFYSYVTKFWAPAAGGLSAIAFVISIFEDDPLRGDSERGVKQD